MATKAELANERNLYRSLCQQALQAEQIFRYHESIDISLLSLSHISGMMQFERRFLKIDNPSLQTLRIVFQYAPILFRMDALTAVEIFLDNNRKTEKHSGLELGKHLESAYEILDIAASTWDAIHKGTNEVLLASTTKKVIASTLITVWSRMNLIVQESVGQANRYKLRTNCEEYTAGKCMNCGVTIMAAKWQFYESFRCHKCSSTTYYAILAQ